MKYRSEVDGLRAVAVIPVLLFHAGVPGFEGGFIGVDIFFVISGFLIGGILLEELDRGRFSLADFYERRARRILPALLLVLLVSSVFAVLVLTPGRLIDYSHYLAGTLLFVSNIVYWQKTHYFAPSAEENPLLHTWSLAIEEQFYLFFPLYMMWLWHRGVRFNARMLLGVALFSFLVALYYGHKEPTANFFLLPGRIWELLVGVLAAIVLRYRQPDAANGPALAGLALLLAGFVLVDGDALFPGFSTLMPVIGTGLIVLYARAGTHVARLLSARPLVAVGLISYSLYLWHQPMLAFARIVGPSPDLSLDVAVALLLVSVPLAWLSYRFVETPFRRRDKTSVRKLSVLLATPAALLLGVAASVHALQGWPDRVDENAQAKLSELEGGTGYVISAFNKYMDNQYDGTGGRKVLVVGDSYAQDTFNVLREAGLIGDGDDVVTMIVPGACQIVLADEQTWAHRKPGTEKLCRRSDENMQRVVELGAQADWLVLSASWQQWAVERLPETIDGLALRDDTAITVFGTKAFEPVSYYAYLNRGKFAWLDYSDYFTRPETHSRINDYLRQAMPARESTLMIDWFELLCDGKRCARSDDAGRLLSYDEGHLTESGARYLADKLRALLDGAH